MSYRLSCVLQPLQVDINFIPILFHRWGKEGSEIQGKFPKATQLWKQAGCLLPLPSELTLTNPALRWTCGGLQGRRASSGTQEDVNSARRTRELSRSSGKKPRDLGADLETCGLDLSFWAGRTRALHSTGPARTPPAVVGAGHTCITDHRAHFN